MFIGTAGCALAEKKREDLRGRDAADESFVAPPPGGGGGRAEVTSTACDGERL